MSSKSSVGNAFGALFSYLFRAGICIAQYAALVISFGLGVCTVGAFTQRIVQQNPTVHAIVYWRDPKRTGIVAGAIFLILILLTRYSALSILAYTGLAMFAAVAAIRAFKTVEAHVKKTGGDSGDPFRAYLDAEITVPQERLHSQLDVLIDHAIAFFTMFRRALLLDNIVDSIKVALLLYTLTYVGAWFSCWSLVFIFFIALFTVPKTYELYKEPIDKYLNIAKENLTQAQNTIEDKLPFLKKLRHHEPSSAGAAPSAPPVEKKEQ